MEDLKKYNSDAFLLSGLRNNNEKALEFLMDKYFVQLAEFCNGFVKNIQQCEEIVADVFYSIWVKRYEIEIHTSLNSYLFVSVKNKALQHVRKKNPSTTPDEDESKRIKSSEPNALEQFIFRELNQDIEFLVNTLPEKRQLIFRLNRFDGFTYKEIAELLDISEKTVVNQISIATKNLRTRYQSIKT